MKIAIHQSLEYLKRTPSRSMLMIALMSLASMVFLMQQALGIGFGERVQSVFQYELMPLKVMTSVGTSKIWQGLPKYRIILMDRELLEEAKARSLIGQYALIYRKEEAMVTLQTGVTTSNSVLGVSPSFFSILTSQLTPNSFPLTQRTMGERRRWVYITQSFAQENKLYLHDTIEINNIEFTVNGVWDETAIDRFLLFLIGSPKVLIPSSTWLRLWEVEQEMTIVTPPYSDMSDVFFPVLYAFLAKHLKFDASDKYALYTVSDETFTIMLRELIRNIERFFIMTGGVTLAIACLGMINNVLLSVKARRAEIGIRLALGATSQQVGLQVLFENTVLVFVSVLIGITSCAGVLMLLSYFPLPDWVGQPTMSLYSIGVYVVLLLTFTLPLISGMAYRISCLSPRSTMSGVN
ncbi:ABC transporter permease [Vibrio profundi]|uniref:ABC transporter permease n=1 Tax=Vibrio profundi TaxID=1774960 RepID=UPI003735959F